MNEHPNNALWASAFILLGMILFVANRHTPQAVAENAITGDGFTMVTSPDGRGTDLLYVIDNQNSLLMVYDVQNPQGASYINPVASWSIPSMFSTVRK